MSVQYSSKSGPPRFLGAASLKLKSYAPALAKVEYILKAYPLDPVFLEQKAFGLAETGKKEEAKEVIRQLILISPSNAYAKSFMQGSK